MVEVVENSLSDDNKHVPDHIAENEDDANNSKIERPFGKSRHMLTNFQCHCRGLALQLKQLETAT